MEGKNSFRGAHLVVALLLGACSGSSDSTLNVPPTVEAGADQTVNENTRVQLAGLVFDPEGELTSATWSQVSGPAVAVDAPYSLTATFQAPQVPIGLTETIVLRLTVTDPRGATATDDVTISVDSADFVVFRATKDDVDKMGLYKYDTQSGEITKLSGTLFAGAFAVSPDGRYVAYLARPDTSGHYELYVVTADGSNVSSVPGGRAGEFAWAPDSSRLGYVADRDTPGVFELYTVNPDGTGNTRVSGTLVAGGMVWQWEWSPASSRLAYLADQDTADVRELYTVNPDGTSNIKVSGALVEGGVVLMDSLLVYWSPDGSRIAYRAIQDTQNVVDLYTVNPDGTGNTKVSGPLVAGGSVVRATWAPDSARIAYLADQDTKSRYELYSVAADGSGLVKLNPTLADSTSGWVLGFDWAPDGSRVAYVAYGQDTPGVYEAYTALSGGGGNARINGPLVAGGNIVSWTQWSPDSAHLVYVAEQDTVGVREVYVSASDGSGNTKVSGPTSPTLFDLGSNSWSPDSSHLVYASDQSTPGVMNLFVANLDGTSNVRISDAHAGGLLRSFARWAADSSCAVYASEQDAQGQAALYMSTPDGSDTIMISGPLVPGGSVDPFWFRWFP